MSPDIAHCSPGDLTALVENCYVVQPLLLWYYCCFSTFTHMVTGKQPLFCTGITRPTGDQTQGQPFGSRLQKFGIRTKGLQLSLAAVMQTEASPAVCNQVQKCKLALKEGERGIFLWPVAFYLKSVASPSWGSCNKNEHNPKQSLFLAREKWWGLGLGVGRDSVAFWI